MEGVNKMTMKTLAFAVAVCALANGTANAQVYGAPVGPPSTPFGTPGMGSNPNSHYVSPYTTHQGTYVGGHYQTNPNNTTRDNFGTSGNYNPYTGSFGTRRY